MLESLIKFIIGLLVFVLIIDPGDLIFRLKIPLFLLIFAAWIVLKTFKPVKIDRDILLISFIFFTVPIIGVLTAILQNNLSDTAFAIGFIKSFSVIILLVVIIDLRVSLDVTLVKYSLIIPLIIIPIYLLLTVNPSLAFQLFNFLSEKDVAKFSNRDFYGYKAVMLYYRTSPLLVFPLAYYCKNLFFDKGHKLISLIFAFLFFFTLILSGTRANMLAGAVIVVYFFFSFLHHKKNKVYLIIGYAIVIFTLVSFIQTLSFSKDDDSSKVKSGHYNSYMNLFEEKPQFLIWGQGLGATFYSSGNRSEVSQTELTYFDLVRWFGIPLTMVLFFLLLYPLIYLYLNKRIDENNKYAIVAYLGYLFIAGTNPLLVSSTGMLVVITLFSLIKRRNLHIPC